ncbi:PREDICTED: palmitoyltransferase ZDHHC22-like [Wasmannia auropunctata]|uniref:palmitoyltransferase ZDHHC22-like n=1 Tax=Wasmannia auropunctata TaxID=64793 RepID=UPI0005EE0186|nr:PREDICTED: palmitoyltransferase ZDHHC22-like [Wasmannia auropunctata]
MQSQHEQRREIAADCCYQQWPAHYHHHHHQQQQQRKQFEQQPADGGAQPPPPPPAHNTAYKFWHCERCRSYMCKPTQHCAYCRKCFHFMDHHCFFLGACVLRQNMGNFILFCFYTSLTCLYSLCVLGPYMYENINHIVRSDADYFNIFLNFCFPIALARLLHSRDSSSILLVTVFDTLMSILCICLVLGIWKLHSCLTGKQRYVNMTGRQNLREIFGSYGLSNIIFPYNGLIGTRDINGKYELKEV